MSINEVLDFKPQAAAEWLAANPAATQAYSEARVNQTLATLPTLPPLLGPYLAENFGTRVEWGLAPENGVDGQFRGVYSLTTTVDGLPVEIPAEATRWDSVDPESDVELVAMIVGFSADAQTYVRETPGAETPWTPEWQHLLVHRAGFMLDLAENAVAWNPDAYHFASYVALHLVSQGVDLETAVELVTDESEQVAGSQLAGETPEVCAAQLLNG
ncbi:hypothetical protein [Leifsonia sp. Leaf264]|uniref:hypothetical protein n=1 Tax=Leifsonia sp. Leaf264 TaxID=1736314 RepID=UPI0006F6E986|nr:hypothetical protein [Leifsonia sp. Leaf264]KQP01413.1 hypothetical protein ASF30_02005 [Leifsonia sp. Leaf264]